MIKTKHVIQMENKALRKDIAFYRKAGLTATVNHLERKLKEGETRLREMSRVHNKSLLEIRTRNGDAFPSGKWEDLR